MINRPMRISIDDETFLDYSSSNITSSNSRTSSMRSLSTLSSQSNSPIQVPIARRLINSISNAVAYESEEENSFTFDDIEDLESNESTLTHSTTSLYNTVSFNTSCYVLNIINIFSFFVSSLITNTHIDKTNPNNDVLYYYSITPFPECKNIKNEVWRLFTYSFVHNGLLHLISNSFVLYVLTYTLYRFQPLYKILILYSLCVIIGAISFFLTNPYDALIGASGGVYGIGGSVLANLFLNYDRLYYHEYTWNVVISLIFILFDIINFLNFYSDSTAYQCHWYGYGSGFFIGLFFYRCKKSTFTKKILQIFSFALFFTAFSLLLYIYINSFPLEYSYNYFKFTKENNCCIELLVNNNSNCH